MHPGGDVTYVLPRFRLPIHRQETFILPATGCCYRPCKFSDSGMNMKMASIISISQLVPFLHPFVKIYYNEVKKIECP
jgi:hypothetical protein